MGPRAVDGDRGTGRAAAPPTLLVVEDDAAIRAAFLEALTQEGFVVELASDGTGRLSQVLVDGVDRTASPRAGPISSCST